MVLLSYLYVTISFCVENMAELQDFELFKQVELLDYARKLSSSDLANYLDKLTVKSGTLPDP